MPQQHGRVSTIPSTTAQAVIPQCPPLQQVLIVNETGRRLGIQPILSFNCACLRNTTGNSAILFFNCACPRNKTEGSTCQCPAPELGSFSYVAQFCEGLLARTPITTCTNSTSFLEDLTDRRQLIGVNTSNGNTLTKFRRNGFGSAVLDHLRRLAEDAADRHPEELKSPSFLSCATPTFRLPVFLA